MIDTATTLVQFTGLIEDGKYTSSQLWFLLEGDLSKYNGRIAECLIGQVDLDAMLWRVKDSIVSAYEAFLLKEIASNGIAGVAFKYEVRNELVRKVFQNQSFREEWVFIEDLLPLQADRLKEFRFTNNDSDTKVGIALINPLHALEIVSNAPKYVRIYEELPRPSLW